MQNNPIENGIAIGASTLKQRVVCRIWPEEHCALPVAPATFKGAVIANIVANLTLRERLMLIVSGRLAIKSHIITDNAVGDTIGHSVVYPLPPKFLS